MNALKLAHFSDLHYANETLAEVDRCFAAAVDLAIDRGAEAAVISGDSTDHRLDVHSPAILAIARQVLRLSNHCPVLMLQGTYSHEPPGTLSIFGLLGGNHPVFIADRFCQVALLANGAWRASQGWCFKRRDELEPSQPPKAIFTCVPTANKAALAAAIGPQNAAEAMGENLAALLRGYGESNQEARAMAIPTIGVSHGTVSGCETEHGVPMDGLDHEFTTGALFASECDAFLLGHIHKHQSWERGGRRVAYAGSIGRLHYGEVDSKGCLLWTVRPDEACFQFAETPARRMVHLDFQGMPDMHELERVAMQCQGAFVRVRWSVDEEHRDAVDREAIKAMLGGAASVKLEPRVVPIVRARAEGMNRTTSLTEKLRMWCKATETAEDGLEEHLTALQTTPPEELAAQILK